MKKDSKMYEVGPSQARKIVAILIIFGIAVGLALAYGTLALAEEEVERRGPWGQERDIPIEVKTRHISSTVVITVNILLLVGLLNVYIKTYDQTHSSFMLGLIFFISVLLIQSILSLPALFVLFGYTGFGLGVFGVLPHLFETMALVILIILSME
jgi:hypothetical protein